MDQRFVFARVLRDPRRGRPIRSMIVRMVVVAVALAWIVGSLPLAVVLCRVLCRSGASTDESDAERQSSLV